MGSFKIKRLNLPQNVMDMLDKQSLSSCKDVLSITKLELQTMLGLSHKNVDRLLCEISKKCVSEPQTAYNIYASQESTSNQFLPLSLHSLDLLLQGGLPLGSITEIAGPPGVGKTQFCFMLSILAALPTPLGGLDGQVIYIDTESAFCAERLKTIAQKRFPQFFKQNEKVIQVFKRILVHKVNSVNSFKEILSQLEKEIIRNQVKLIIVDSVASLLRKEFGTDGFESLMERNKILVEQAAILKDIAQTYKIAVFLTNQITSQHVEIDSILPDYLLDDNEEDLIHFNLQTSGTSGVPPPAPVLGISKPKRDADHVLPALGNTWSHCVNTRLVAQFLDSTIRQLTISKSPIAPTASVKYRLDESGICLIDDDIEFENVSRVHKTILTKYNFLTTKETGTGVVFSTGAENNL